MTQSSCNSCATERFLTQTELVHQETVDYIERRVKQS